jgi:nitrous oxide reductase accessory protein NosL
MKLIAALIVTLLAVTLVSPIPAAELKPRKPGAGDKCPVCGMFVAKFPDFAAQVQFKDGSTFHFDGSKDLFKYYQAASRYTPGKSLADVSAVFVTSYYTLTPINGLTAWYVAGSDVYGPMGRDLIPFANENEAREFKKDHKGKSILRFKEITPVVIKGLD